MNLNFNVTFDCSICRTSLNYLLEQFKDDISYEWNNISNHDLKNKSNQLKLTIDSSRYEEIKKHFSKNIYDEGCSEVDSINDVKKSKKQSLVTYVSDDVTNCQNCHLIPFVVFYVSNKQLLGELISKLNLSYKIPSQFKFLKRINSSPGIMTKVLLYPQSSKFDFISAKEYLMENNVLSDLYTEYVYFNPPTSRNQFNKYKSHWPCSFHPNCQLEKLLMANSGCSDSELKRHYLLMKRACLIGEQSTSEKKIGVVIYDSSKQVTVSESYDCRNNENILNHAVIVALDRLAQSQGGNKSDDICNLPPLINNPGGYLCTGWDVYVSAAPCLMCSMALVHSRISKLFYTVGSNDGTNIYDDGVSSLSHFKLFSMKSLNHNFDVYEINFDN